jgi:hypothetical protein
MGVMPKIKPNPNFSPQVENDKLCLEECSSPGGDEALRMLHAYNMVLNHLKSL